MILLPLVLAIGALYLIPTGVKGLSMPGLIFRAVFITVVAFNALTFVGHGIDKAYDRLASYQN